MINHKYYIVVGEDYKTLFDIEDFGSWSRPSALVFDRRRQFFCEGCQYEEGTEEMWQPVPETLYKESLSLFKHHYNLIHELLNENIMNQKVKWKSGLSFTDGNSIFTLKDKNKDGEWNITCFLCNDKDIWPDFNTDTGYADYVREHCKPLRIRTRYEASRLSSKLFSKVNALCEQYIESSQ